MYPSIHQHTEIKTIQHVYKIVKDIICTYHMIIIDEYGCMNHQGKLHNSDLCLQDSFVSVCENIFRE